MAATILIRLQHIFIEDKSSGTIISFSSSEVMSSQDCEVKNDINDIKAYFSKKIISFFQLGETAMKSSPLSCHYSHSKNKNPFTEDLIIKKEKKLLQIFLITYLNRFFYSFYKNKIQLLFKESFKLTVGSYDMDRKIIETILNEIVLTGEYTLEGIATYTKIPLDILIDTSCGVANQLSVTPWTRIVDLYMQVKPDVSKIFHKKLITELEEKNFKISSILSIK